MERDSVIEVIQTEFLFAVREVGFPSYQMVCLQEDTKILSKVADYIHNFPKSKSSKEINCELVSLKKYLSSVEKMQLSRSTQRMIMVILEILVKF